MRISVSITSGLALLATAVFGSAPAGAFALPAAPALKDAASAVNLAEPVCWDCGGYGYSRPYYRPYYRPYHRPYYGDGYGYHRPYYRPYYRPYGYGPRPYYRPYGYGPRPYYSGDYGPRPYWGGGGYYGPRPYWGGGGYYRPYAPPPWVSGPYFVRRYYY